jgi:hypothetical protein
VRLARALVIVVAQPHLGQVGHDVQDVRLEHLDRVVVQVQLREVGGKVSGLDTRYLFSAVKS